MALSCDCVPVVIDCGSGWTRAGFSGEDEPRVQFRTIVGRSAGADGEALFFGEEASVARDIFKISFPIEWGVVANWKDMENVLEHTFHTALRVSPEEHAVLLTEPAFTPKMNRKKMAELLFETFLCPAMCLGNQAALALAAAGRSNGLVLDVGEGISHCVPVYEGYIVQRGIQHRGLDGGVLTQLLRTMLTDAGNREFSRERGSVVRDMKERLCFVALDFDQEKKTATAESYKLPDGRSIDIASERFRCPEALFQPTAAGLDGQGVPEKIFDSIMKVDVAIRRDLFANVVLAGGSTMFRGFAERLQKELDLLAPQGMTAKVVAPPQRQLSTWIGGSVLTAQRAFEERWVRKEDYEEMGPDVLQRKCF